MLRSSNFDRIFNGTLHFEAVLGLPIRDELKCSQNVGIEHNASIIKDKIEIRS